MKKKYLQIINAAIKSAFYTAFTVTFFLASGVHSARGQEQVVWYPMQKAQKLAKKNNKKVLIYAGASWCGYCQKMDQEVFPRQRVIDSLNAYFYGVRLNIESQRPIIFNGEQMSAFQFARKHRVRATPTFFFLSSDGTIIGAQPGFMPADTFSQLLGYIGSGAYKKMEFGAYLKKFVEEDSKQ